MRDKPEMPAVADHEAKLELALIEEFLRRQGHNLQGLASLEAAERDRLLHDASLYAAGKLAEIEARAHYVEDLHRHE
jgi:hypothetical protein